MKRSLTERDIETLGELDAATRNHEEVGWRNGWCSPMDCGGRNGSHHSKTLAKLAAHGLAIRRKYGHKREKGSCHYKISDAGRGLLDLHHNVIKPVPVPKAKCKRHKYETLQMTVKDNRVIGKLSRCMTCGALRRESVVTT